MLAGPLLQMRLGAHPHFAFARRLRASLSPQALYRAIQPPSTNSGVPVTYDDASEARNTTAPVNSSSSPHRPIGICATNSLYFTGSSRSERFMSVAKAPGQMAFAVTPVPAHSSASTRVRLMIPAFDEA